MKIVVGAPPLKRDRQAVPREPANARGVDVRLAVRLGLFGLLAALGFMGAGVVVGLSGALGALAIALNGAMTTLALLAATAICIRISASSWRDVGVDVAPRRLGDLAVGFVVGALLFVTVLVVQGLLVRGHWTLGSASIGSVGAGLAVVLCLFFAEELLFRGYAFRQLADGLGARFAIGVSASAFGVYHVLLSGNWAMGAVYTFLMSASGGLVFGYALYRSGSLALPVGLHWGGNWVQANVLGLGHAASSSALWVLPLTPDQARWLLAPDLLQHLPYLLGLLGVTLFVHHHWQARHGLPTG